jgi:DNA-binding NarL/FixJ family response regulator
VGLVDDQHLVRAGFRMVIDSQPDLDVVAEAADGAAALAVFAATAADVVLMDVRMPVLDGIEATRQLVALPAAPRVIVLTTFDQDDYVLAAIGAGASGFLLKDAPPEEMLAAVRTVHAGDAVIGASSTRRLLRQLGPMLNAPSVPAPSSPAASPTPADPPFDLTPREFEVFVLIGAGLSNTEIARRLVVSEATVKTHVGKVLTKTGARDRVHVVVLAYQLGVVRP